MNASIAGMEVTDAELSRRYADMEDEALLQIALERLALTERARQVLQDEATSRGLELPDAQALPQEPAFDVEHWVTIERFRDLSAGIVARSALEAAEIKCFLRDENTVRMDWQISNFIGGMRLQVLEHDAEEATAVLAGLAIDELPEDDAAEELAGDRCPRCGSGDVHRRPQFGILSLASVLALNIPAPQGKRRWSCNACGNEWADTQDY